MFRSINQKQNASVKGKLLNRGCPYKCALGLINEGVNNKLFVCQLVKQFLSDHHGKFLRSQPHEDSYMLL